MDILVDKYMREIESNDVSNNEMLSEIGSLNLDVTFEDKQYVIDIWAVDIDPDWLTITAEDIQELNVEISGVWCKLDHKFLTKYPETFAPFMTEINKSLEKYLNKKGIY